MTKKFFNLHRHSPAKDLEETAIINIFPGDDVPEKDFYSVGLHPWHLSESTMKRDLELVAEKGKSAAAVGECGLDRACKVSFDLQMKVFRRQVEIAASLDKPVVIHCVRAYPDITSERKAFPGGRPWIIHGFRGNIQTASQLVGQGFYLSFGKALLEDKRLGDVLAGIPTDRFFLETDDSGMDIVEIYKAAAGILGVSPDALGGLLESNARKVFPLQS